MTSQYARAGVKLIRKAHDFFYYKCPESWRGTLDYYYNRPHYRTPFGGAFNGQQFRRLIFNELLVLFPFDSLVETGTYTGNTTDYMSEHVVCPIYSVEQSTQFYQYSKLRLRHRAHVHLAQADSRTFLTYLVDSENASKRLTFFYLDAHWNADLPLADELQIIFDGWEDPVVMIDDFQVPGDSGYFFDDYGPGAALTLDYLPKSVLSQCSVFFPNTPSTNETGDRKRGCVVLAKQVGAAKGIRQAHYLREYTPVNRSSKSCL